MFANLNSKINERYEAEIDKTQEQICILIRERSIPRKWYKFLSSDKFNNVDFNELTIKGGTIEIERRSSTLTPFAGNGRITMKMADGATPGRTKIDCNIIPFDGLIPLMLSLEIAGVTTILFLILYFGPEIPWVTKFGLIMSFYAVPLGFSYGVFRITKLLLRSYSKAIIEILNCAAS